MKTKALIAVVLLMLCSLGMEAAKVKGNGKVITKDIAVADYDRIEIGISYSSDISSLFSSNSKEFAFYYKQSDAKATLQVTLDENLFSSLDISSTGGKLVIKTQKNTQIVPTKITFNGNSKNLRGTRTSGSIDFILQSPLNGDKLEIAASGSSDVILDQPVRLQECTVNCSGSSDFKASNLNCDQLKLSFSGSSDANIKGKAEQAEYNASGSSDIKAYDFIVKDLKCSASGSSDIYANATGTLEASASGGSDIHYRGNAQAKTSKSGGSDIHKE